MDFVTLATQLDTPPPENMHTLMWWIIGILCTVVTAGFTGGGRMIYKALTECKEDRKKLFQENENDRKEFYREVQSLTKDKLRLTREVAYVAGQCSIDLSCIPTDGTESNGDSI